MCFMISQVFIDRSSPSMRVVAHCGHCVPSVLSRVEFLCMLNVILISILLFAPEPSPNRSQCQL